MMAAADDVVAIRAALEHERGVQAAFLDAVRDAPAGCLDLKSWYAGYDEGRDIKRKAA